MSGVLFSGGRITPSVSLSFSLRGLLEPVDPVVEGSCGSIFSGIVFRGAGMFGGRCCGDCDCAVALNPPARSIAARIVGARFIDPLLLKGNGPRKRRFRCRQTAGTG
jgi:hypothetical protein